MDTNDAWPGNKSPGTNKRGRQQPAMPATSPFSPAASLRNNIEINYSNEGVSEKLLFKELCWRRAPHFHVNN